MAVSYSYRVVPSNQAIIGQKRGIFACQRTVHYLWSWPETVSIVIWVCSGEFRLKTQLILRSGQGFATKTTILVADISYFHKPQQQTTIWMVLRSRTGVNSQLLFAEEVKGMMCLCSQSVLTFCRFCNHATDMLRLLSWVSRSLHLPSIVIAHDCQLYILVPIPSYLIAILNIQLTWVCVYTHSYAMAIKEHIFLLNP